MLQFNYKITDQLGLHARPAGLLAKCAQNCTSSVTLKTDTAAVNAKKLFSIMGLAIKKNDLVTFIIQGENEQTDCNTLKAFCQENI